MNRFQVQCVTQLIIVFIITVINAAPALDTVWHKHAGRIESGLYNTTDHIVILNSKNLKNTIYNTKNAWIVEFYANWCPHCQRFATVWKTFGHSIDNWKDIVNVGAFDCATESNSPFCKEYNVSFVPAIKYFPPYSKPDMLGHPLDKVEVVELLRDVVIELLEKEQNNGSNLSWPNLTYLQNVELNNMFTGLSKNVKYYFIIFEEPDSYLGLSTILDFHKVSQILIRRVSSNNKELCDAFKVQTFPSLIVVERANITSNLTFSTPSRTAVFTQIKSFLSSKGIEINIMDVMDDLTIMKNYLPKRTFNRTAVLLKDDDVYQADLDSALQYSLNQEIALAQNITGDQMKALRNYLEVLAEYFPMKFGSPQFLKGLYNAVKNKTSIDGQEFKNLIASLKHQSNSSHDLNWVGCKGSLPYSRRYTCGLWTMFHTLTVRYAIASNERHLEPDTGGKVILAMYNYAKHFFGCSHCAEHFVHMANKRHINDVKTANQAVLWLWEAHNEVNERLAGDITEDPEFPKIQYPAKQHCSKCRNANDTWNEVEVLNYLKDKYSGNHFKYDLTL